MEFIEEIEELENTFHKKKMLWSRCLQVGLVLLCLLNAYASLQSVLDKICNVGDLSWGYQRLWKYASKAEALHSLSNLEVILHGNITGAVSLHRMGKAASATVIPPLAQFHLQGKACGGLGDLFYVTAVITKQMVDSNIDPVAWQDALTTLITLSADSGLYEASERLMTEALALSPDAALRFRAALMTPGVYPSLEYIHSTRERLLQRVQQLYADRHQVQLKTLDEFVLSPTFYFIYQGYNDRHILTMLQDSYAAAYKLFGQTDQIEANMQHAVYFHQTAQVRKIRVGFVSSHFRRHSICKLYCGIMTNLDPNIFEVYAFSSLQGDSEDEMTKTLRDLSNKKGSHFHYVSIGKTFAQNRDEVLSRRIDVLIYLDIGMEPATSVWASARLAPIQGCLWGHPSTTGLAAMDFYLSSNPYHQHRFTNTAVAKRHLTPYEDGEGDKQAIDVEYAQSFFQEQLVQFDTLGFYFHRPTLADVITESGDSYEELLVHRPLMFYERVISHLQGQASAAGKILVTLAEKKKTLSEQFRILLCPQHLPKFHPTFDEILLHHIMRDPNTVVVLVDNQKKAQWKRTLMQRWKEYIVAIMAAEHSDKTAAEINQLAQNTLQQIIWMPSMKPQEYLLLLSLGDVMLDQFPFGGGVTTLESLAVCTPVVTLPKQQNVPQLAAGMLRSLQLSSHVADILIVQSNEEYIHSIDEVIASSAAIRGAICSKILKEGLLFEDASTVQEWNTFFTNAVEHFRTTPVV